MTVALFNNVRDVMTRFFSATITNTAEARTSIKRIEVLDFKFNVTVKIFKYYSLFSVFKYFYFFRIFYSWMKLKSLRSH